MVLNFQVQLQRAALLNTLQLLDVYVANYLSEGLDREDHALSESKNCENYSASLGDVVRTTVLLHVEQVLSIKITVGQNYCRGDVKLLV